MFDGTLQSLLIRMFQEQDLKFIKAIQGGKLVLGGDSSGEYGGPDNPAGFVGKLSQRNVCYDTDEFASSGSTSGGSEPCLVNNLNRIRGGYAMGNNFLENRHVQWGISGGSISARSIPFSSGSISADNVRDAIGEAYQHGGGGHDFDGNTWIIGDGDDADFASPAAAQSDASVADGDVLLIYPGTYDGFTLTKNLSLVGGIGDSGNDGIATGRVVISGLSTAMDIQAESSFQHIVFEDDDVTINTADTVSFEHCRNSDYNLTCGAYAVNVILKDSYWYDLSFGSATGGQLYVWHCDGGFSIDHGAAALYIIASDYSAPIVGSGARYTTPDEHAEKTAATSTPVQVMDWVADSTGAPAAGFGVRHKFSLESGAGEGQDAAAIDVVWEDATGASEDSAITFNLRVAGAALAERFRIGGLGATVPDDYWIGLGPAAGRVEFDNQAEDEINFRSCRVGVGTAAPACKLDVHGATNVIAKVHAENGWASFEMRDQSATNLGLFDFREGTGAGTVVARFAAYSTGHAFTPNQFYIENRMSGGKIHLDTTTGGGVRGTRLTIDGDGNIGIGTMTPGSLMEWNFATENLEFVDAGSAGATEQDWIEVRVGGVTGYIRVYAAK